MDNNNQGGETENTEQIPHLLELHKALREAASHQDILFDGRAGRYLTVSTFLLLLWTFLSLHLIDKIEHLVLIKGVLLTVAFLGLIIYCNCNVAWFSSCIIISSPVA